MDSNSSYSDSSENYSNDPKNRVKRDKFKRNTKEFDRLHSDSYDSDEIHKPSKRRRSSSIEDEERIK